MKIGTKIRKARVQKKMTQEELADLLDTTQKTISNFESDKTHPTLGQLAKLQEVLDLNIFNLLKEMGVTFHQTNDTGTNSGLAHVVNYYESEKLVEALQSTIVDKDKIIAQ